MGDYLLLIPTEVDAIGSFDSSVERLMRRHQLGEERFVLGIVHVRERRTFLGIPGVEHGLGATLNFFALGFRGSGQTKLL